MADDAASDTPPVSDNEQDKTVTATGDADNTASPVDGQEGSADAKQTEADPSKGDKDAKKEPETLLSQVEKALKKDEEKPDPEKSSDSKQENQQSTDGKKEDEKSSEEPAVPAEFHKHPAWQRMQKQRDDAVAEATTHRDNAQRFELFHNYLSSTGLTPAQAVEAMDLSALAIKKPEEFFTKLQELYYDWGVVLKKGILPPDLQKQVDEGAITAEIAGDYALQRVRTKSATAMSEAATEAVYQGKAQSHAQEVNNALSGWLTVQSKDPEFAKKRGFVQTEIRALVAKEGRPEKPADFVAMADRALKTVNERLSPFTPAQRKPEKNPVRHSSSSSRAAASAPPKTVMEAVQRGIAMSANG